MHNPGETALLLVCPLAEPAVAGLRTALDTAAQEGVPAHVTVLYPFKSETAIEDDDHRRLESIFASVDPFVLRAAGPPGSTSGCCTSLRTTRLRCTT